MFRIATIVSLVVSSVCIVPVRAQFADVLTVVVPKHIRSGEKIQLTLQSPSFELDRAMVVWALDGTERAQGIGQTTFETTLSDTAAHTLTVTAVETGGITRSESVILAATDIDLLWEAETLTPPLYKGRALATAESFVRAEVMLHGVKDTLPATHIYTWTLNGRKMPTASGLGKHTVRVALPPFQTSHLLAVTTKNLQGEFTGEASVRIDTVQPFVTFYPVLPLIGMWTNTALTSSTAAQEASPRIIAFPFFMRARSPRDPNLSYTWTFPKGDEDDRKDDESPAEVTIRTTEPFSVVVRQTNTLLQEALGIGSLSTDTREEGGASLFGIEDN